MMTQKLPPLLAVVGPTASGKTALGIRLAQILGGEILCADSMQVYRGMDIATAAPTAEEKAAAVHHLTGILDPEEPFSVADYAARAHEVIAEIHARGHLPILVGGTGLYIDAVMDNMDFSADGADPAIRAALEARLAAEGVRPLFDELAARDPEIAARLHPNNTGRVLRALEVMASTGLTMTEYQRRAASRPARYRTCRIGVDCRDRALLYARIEARIRLMEEAGLWEEARRAYEKGGAATAAQAIGHKELFPHFAGEKSRSECLAALAQATRHYAKRQRTWFYKNEAVHWFYREDYPAAEDMAQAAAAAARLDLGV